MKLSPYSWLIGREPAAQFLRVFRDRSDAGARLAARLEGYQRENALVLGLARGGVPVAYEVARALNAELDVLVVRRLAAPSALELAIGAIAADGTRYLNEPLIAELGVPAPYVERVARAELVLARRQEERLRSQGGPNVMGRTVFLVDDGLATGATMIAAARSLRAGHPARLIVAVPVASEEACAELHNEADEVVCYLIPQPFWAVGLHYQYFDQIDDAGVESYLRGPLRDRLSA